MGRKIAYIMSRFPHLPETFILREMNKVRQYGLDVALYPLILQEEPVRHRETDAWPPKVRRLPFLSSAIIVANLRWFARDPWKFISIWARTLKENLRSPNFLIRAAALFPKAAYAAQLMQREDVQHIHAHFASHPALVAWIIHQFTGIHYSVTVHAHDIFVRKVMLETKLRQADFIVAISAYNRDYLAKSLGSWVMEKTKVIHCGVEPGLYEPAQLIQEGQRLEIIHVGSLQPYKGQKFLVEACAQLKQLGLPFRCRIIGEGEERARLEALIARNGLREQVELLGAKKVDEIAELLSSANCYVQPSIITPSGKMEGIPVALMEAMACQLPVIASDLSGIPELVRPSKTGYLVPPADAKAIAEACIFLHQHPQEAAQLARAGRQLVEREFNLSANVSQLVRQFDQRMGPATKIQEHPSFHNAQMKSTVATR
jgi:colanic acid/amylovoran biosynthesis glycosyltransferase